MPGDFDMDYFNTDIPKWFNNLELQLYVRDPKKYDEKSLGELRR
jgi:hypothetical protein